MRIQTNEQIKENEYGFMERTEAGRRPACAE